MSTATPYTVQYGWVDASTSFNPSSSFVLPSTSSWLGSKASGITASSGGWVADLVQGGMWPLSDASGTTSMSGYLSNAAGPTFNLPAGTRQVLVYIAATNEIQSNNVTYGGLQFAAYMAANDGAGYETIGCAVPYLNDPTYTPANVGWSAAVSAQSISGAVFGASNPEVFFLGWSKPAPSVPQYLAFVLLTAQGTTGTFDSLQVVGMNNTPIAVQGVVSSVALGNSLCPPASRAPPGTLQVLGGGLIRPPSPASTNSGPGAAGGRSPSSASGDKPSCPPCQANADSPAVPVPCVASMDGTVYGLAGGLGAAIILFVVFLVLWIRAKRA